MDRLTRISLKSPRLTLVALGLLTLLLGTGLPHVQPEFGYRPLLGGEHPSIRTLEQFIENFEIGGLPIQIVWECGVGKPCVSALDPESLRMAYALTRTLQPLAGIQSVQSPATTPVLVPEEEGFAVRRLVESGRPVSDTEALAARVVQDPLWVGNLVSSDGSVGVILVQPSDSRSTTSVRVVEAVREALAPFEARGFEFHLVGHAVEFAVAGPELAESTARLIPITTLIIALVLFVLSRSLWIVTISLGTLGLALVWTFGLLGWLEWPQDHILDVLAPLILVVGVCDTIHFFTAYATEIRACQTTPTRRDRTAASLRAAREVGGPCLLTSLTTAAAFLSFVTSNLETFVRFGLIASFGTLSCLILTFTLLPVVLCWTSIDGDRRGRESGAWDSILDAVIRTSERRTIPILATTVLLFVVCGIGWLGYLRVDTNRYEMFGDRSAVMQWLRFVEDRLGHSDNLEIEIQLPSGAAIEDPETLRVISDFSTFLSSVEGLGHTRSGLDIIGWLNRLVHDDDPAFQRPADTLHANAELLELATFQYPSVLDGWMSFDRSRFRISVDASLQSVTDRGKVLSTVNGYVHSRMPLDWDVSLTGPFAIEFQAFRDLQRTQTQSFGVAFLLVFGVVALFFRSIRHSALGMVPTLLPVVVILGVMGWAGSSLDVGRSMIAVVLLGISVDDSVHLLSRYRRQRAKGDSPRAAIRTAVLDVGRAVVTTSLALSLGFLTLLASAWQTVSGFGLFVSIGILGALAADLFVLPSLILAFARGTEVRRTDLPAEAVTSTSARRPIFALATVAPVAVVIALAWILTLQPGNSKEPGCWVLPNGHIALLPGFESNCPLHPNERIKAIQVPGGEVLAMDSLQTLRTAIQDADSTIHMAVVRGGKESWFEVPVYSMSLEERVARVGSITIIAAVLLCIPLLLLWRSSSAAAQPFALFYSATAILVVVTICGRLSGMLSRAGLLAVVAAPAILMHLSLTFPTERRVVRAAPRLVVIPYLASALLLVAAWVALERDAALWPPMVFLVLTLTAGAWIILVASCGFAIRESASSIERGRARVLWYGSLFLPLLPTILLARHADGVPQILATYLAVAVILIPLPVGLAISRYNLFNLELDIRNWVARVVYFGTGALLITIVFWVGSIVMGQPQPALDPAVVFALSFACVAFLDPLRRRLLGLLEILLSARVNRLGKLRGQYAEKMAELRDVEHVGQILGDTLREATGSRAGCVFLRVGSEWRPVNGFGESPPTSLALAEAARSLERGSSILHLSAEPVSEGDAAERLRAVGVEVVALLRQGPDPVGVVLLTERKTRDPYTRLELDFVEAAAQHATMALHNAWLAENLLAAERNATTGRIALALAHDVGKDLDWLRKIVRRLPQRLEDGRRLVRDLGTVQELTEELARSIRAFIHDVNQPTHKRSGMLEVNHLVERAVQTISRVHGDALIVRNVEPGVRSLRVHQNFERVLVNLLDNAVIASEEADPIRLFATLDRGSLQIVVTDHGHGMDERVMRRAFEPGFTTRADSGGSGVGLAISREIVESLGGRIDLSSSPVSGTIATVQIPINGDLSYESRGSHSCERSSL